jgi:sulfur transfer complex TusBCD TusB component (DsrH family)
MAVRVMAPLHFYVLYIGNGISLHIEQWHLVQTLKTRKIYIMQKGINSRNYGQLFLLPNPLVTSWSCRF